MEVLIDVPPFLHPYVEWFLLWSGKMIEIILSGWVNLGVAWNLFTASLAQLLDIPRNALVPILGALFLFWPVLLSLLMAFATAWAWMFWLFTGVVVGLVQVVYVSYHFFMIAADVAGLSVLKTYSMIRNQVLNVLDKAGSTRKSKRREWQQQLKACQGYEDYMKIRLHAKDIPEITEKDTDAALPPAKTLRRISSHNAMESPTRKLRRNQSFNDKKASLEHAADPVVRLEMGDKLADLLAQTTTRLKEARQSQTKSRASEEKSSLAYVLSGVVKRNHLQLDDFNLDNARSIAEMGQYGLTAPTRSVIRDYVHQVEQGLDWLAEAPIVADSSTGSEEFPGWEAKSGGSYYNELTERLTLVRKMKQNMGRTALMLSGGGAQAMYHIGVIRGLLESKLYDELKVISGTSGGSIVAAMCAMKTPEELYTSICIPTVVTDYKKNGEQKKKNIRWFPSITEMATYWLKHKLLVDSAFFRQTCDFYYGDTTFEEAFEKTGKHVCITVSASRATGGTVQRLLLNHISTPHVTIASAVAASCALPGVMAPAKLLSKNSAGELEPFEVDGVEWIDGSVQADLPFQRISTLFAVSSFIVSQTNFHILPFLNKAHHPSQKSLYWRLFSTIEWDIRSRALKLSRLGLFPRMFGQDISKIFEQQYHGNLTIVPQFTTMQTFGLKSLSNPTEADMEAYIKFGQIATWPWLNAIRDLMRLEKALDDCLHRLEDRVRALNEDWLMDNDDIESIASSSAAQRNSGGVRIIGRPVRGSSAYSVDSERFKQLEQENARLKKELELLQAKMSLQDSAPSTPVSSNGNRAANLPKKNQGHDFKKTTSDATDTPVEEGDGAKKQENDSTTRSKAKLSEPTTLADGSEGKVWNMIKSSTWGGISKAGVAATDTPKQQQPEPPKKELSEIEKARKFASTVLADVEEREKPTIGSWFAKQKEKIQNLVEDAT